MQDAKEIQEIKLEFNGSQVEKTKTFVTEYGDVYIGLYVKGCWVNIRSSELKKYIKDSN